MTTHQTLKEYKGGLQGSPQYMGIEYDYEVPDNMTVSSPGGVSSTQHHFTKGFYGYGASRSDMYAGEGNIYPSGEYGNVYRKGDTAAWNQYPEQYSGYYNETHGPGYPPSINPQYNKPNHREDFKVIENIPPPKDDDTSNIQQTPVLPKIHKLKIQVNPFVLFFLVVLIYICFGAWYQAAEHFASEKIFKGKSLSWKGYLLAAVIMTAGILALAHLFNVPLITFEEI